MDVLLEIEFDIDVLPNIALALVFLAIWLKQILHVFALFWIALENDCLSV
jgi:hypothetical protein